MVRDLSMLQQAKQRADQDIANLRDQVTKQRSQIAVLKDLVDQVCIDTCLGQLGIVTSIFALVICKV